MNADFRLVFESNASLVIAQMRQLEAQALRTQSVLNQIGATNARTAAAGGGPAALGGLSATSVGAVPPSVDRLSRSLGNLQSKMQAVSALGLQPTLRQTRTEMELLQQITAAGGPTWGRYNSATSAAAAGLGKINPAAAQSAKELASQRAALDSTSQAFQRHVGRIQETVLVYAALAAAAAGVTSAVSLASTIDTESRRLEAVLDLNPQQGREFVGGLFQTAVSTATPTESLLGESDFVASAFAGVTDEAEKQRLSLELLNRVGQVTTVTQRDVGVETENLIAIMKLGGLSVDQLGEALGGIVAVGNNSSTAISAILDALQIAIPGARLAGVSIEQLTALVGLFRQQTQRDGNSIGSTFRTLFQTITQPEAENNISELTAGMVELRDASGNLRPALEVLLQIRALADSGAIDPGKLQDIFKAFAPPLNPGAAADIEIIFGLLDQLPAALREVETSGSDALDRLVEKLNAALGPQFRILIEQIKAGFFELFGDDIINAGQTLIDLVRSIGAIIQALPPDLVRFVGQIIALAAAVKGATFVGGALLSLLGVGGLVTAFQGAGAAAVTAGVGTGIFAGAVGAATVVLGRFLPLLAAWAAIDFAQQVGEQQAALKAQIGGLTEGLNADQLRQLRDRLEGQRGGGFSLLADPREAFTGKNTLLDVEGGLKSFTTDPAISAGIEEIDRLLGILDERGANATVTADDLGEGFLGAADASQSVEDALATQAEELERLIAQYTDGANAASQMTEAQRIEADSARLLEFTHEKQAADLEKLADRLRTGKISAEEFAQGQQLVSQAADLAAQLVAIAGDKLAEYPIFAAAAKEGEEQLTQAVYDQIVASGGSINAIGGLIQQLGNLAAANAATAGSLAAHPLIIRMAIEKVSSTDLANNPELSAARRFAQTVTGRSVTNPFGSAGADRELNAILDSLNNLFSGAGAGTAAFGNIPSLGSTSSTRSAPSPNILDLGDFDAAKLADAIALAFRLQGSIPGATEAAQDEVLNLIQDAQFLQQVSGLDDELLRKAIEHLTDVEEARLALEKERANLLANVQVNTGPLSSLISQPFSFGTSGAFLGGTGFNSDPSRQGVTVNIGTITGQTLTAAQISQLMYQAISRALADAAKL